MEIRHIHNTDSFLHRLIVFTASLLSMFIFNQWLSSIITIIRHRKSVIIAIKRPVPIPNIQTHPYRNTSEQFYYCRPNEINEKLFFLLSDDDSDGDLVTDYLSSTNEAQDINNSNKSSKLMAQASHNNNHHNMVPIISVTPHSPGTKYNNILGKTLSHKSVGSFYFNSILLIKLNRGHTQPTTKYTRKRC